MQETHSQVHYPSNLNELLNRKNHSPKAVIWAGGTGIMGDQDRKKPTLPGEIIQTSRISELRKIRRTERFLEIGSGAVINRVLHVGQHVLPPALSQAMLAVSPSVIRNMATIGGHLCYRKSRLNLFSVMVLMDVSLELKRSGKSRWIQLNRLFDKSGNIQIKNNEIMTRIRIPFGSWNLQLYRSDGNPFFNPADSISFTVLADIQKGMVDDFRMIIGNTGRYTFRNKEIESIITGQKLPLASRDLASLGEKYEEWIGTLTGELSPFQRHRSIRFFRWLTGELIP